MKQFNNIDDLFSQELKDFKPEVPVALWEGIESNIPVHQKKSIFLPLLKVAAGVAILLTTTFISISYLNRHDNPDLLVEQEESTISKQNVAEPIAEVQEMNAEPIINNTQINAKQKVTQTIVPQRLSAPKEKNQATLLANNTERVAPQLPIISSIGTIQIEYEEDYVIDEKMPYSDIPLALVAAILNEQESSGDWSIGGQAGPQYTYRDLSSNEYSDAALSNYNQESGMLAYSGGINFQYKTKGRLSIESGIYYSRGGESKPGYSRGGSPNAISTNGVNPESNERMADIIIINSTGSSMHQNTDNKTSEFMMKAPQRNTSVYNQEVLSDDVPLNNAYEFEQIYNFVELPLIARYALVDKKIGIQLIGGISTRVFLGSQKFDVTNDRQNLGSWEGNYSTLNYSSIMGLGLNYAFNDDVQISLEPRMNYQLNDFNNSPEFNVHQYSFGLMSGITYLF